ncbi:hypothetical protein CEE37_14675 [candidate division LCP-89 bacterium B3_LCP]|uniref:precorrin-2 dehydrogenase n=1 Tax=candidate division LCP-89 bacterium B3_LCP TaxID=2012998 RepID=A0A532UPU6_UNCL8|nr:MAG: hypothetical protein CEE37_14675 [candidate division LCP-89 bacterium B3_LCP]
MKSVTTYLPLFFNLNDQACLVVGGGRVALRKVEQLLIAGAKVTVVSPQIHPELKQLLKPDECVWLCRKYEVGEVSFYRLVIATTNDSGLNRQIYNECEQHGIPVNVVDQPELCMVIFPSIIRKGIMTLAISSAGKAPFFTKALREKLEEFLESSHLLDKPELLVKFREFVRRNSKDSSVKERAYEKLVSCDAEQWMQWSESEPPYDLWLKWLEEDNG